MNQRGQQAVSVLMITVGVIGVIVLLFKIVSSENFPSISQFMASTTSESLNKITENVLETSTSTDQSLLATQININSVVSTNPTSPIKEVIAPKGNISVEISNTPSKRAQGLSGREFLNSGTGMLFIFPTPGIHNFWMKDMNFPLDIVWINADRKVVGISSNISPLSYPTVFKPINEIQFVLEMNAREASLYGIATGTILKF